MFAAETYQKRRNELKKRMGKGLLFFPGNNESPMNYRANTYPFRQDSTFMYYFGINLPGFAGIIDCDSGEDILFGPDWTIDDIIWMGPQPSLEEYAVKSGCQKWIAIEKLKEYFDSHKGAEIHYLPPYREDITLMLADLLGQTPSWVKQHHSVDFIRAVVAQREIKDELEVAEIEKALEVSWLTHLAAMQQTRPGMREREIVALMNQILEKEGMRASFPTIFSVHGEILHNHGHHHVMEEGRLVVNDSGVETEELYASDITRTFPVAKKFTPQQRDIYEIVLSAQLAAIDAIRPGVYYREIHLLAARNIAEGLKAIGLMKGNTDDIVEQGAHALFFPHGLGHMLGLDVHDMENLGEQYVGYDDTVNRSNQFGLAYLRLAKPLKPGFVLTVEPGIYFIPALITQWKKERKFTDFIAYDKLDGYLQFGGIRIEDDVLVTRDGHRVLGRPIPKTLTEIENLRQG